MKNTILAVLLFTTFNARADFSTTILGQDLSIEDKDFNQHNLENLHRGHKEIILTFDDGPTPGVTDKILDILKDQNVKATFFVVAENAQKNPKLMKRIFDEGHIVANHSLSHQALKDLNVLTWKKIVRKEVLDAHTIIAPYMGNGKHFYYRAPEGAWAQKYANLLNETDVGRKYIGPVLWDIGGSVEISNGKYTQAADWACWSKKMTVDECLSGYMNESRRTKGGVVLMHDLRSLSAQMLEKYIPALEAEGFTFRTLDDVNWNGRF